MSTKRKTVRSTAAQLRVLVDYMAVNPMFAAGEFSGPLGNQKSEREWVDLVETLSGYGPQKSVDQWKHTWRDLKKRARQEASAIRQARASTGNKTVIPNLSEQSRKILETIGFECATGIASEGETGLGDQSENTIPDFEVELEVEGDQEPVEDVQPVRRCPQAPSCPKRAKPFKTKASTFIELQKKTNKILEEVSNELKKSNDLRIQQLAVLHAISDKMSSLP